MVKRNIPDWQRSAFDKDNNSCVKTKLFGKRIKELEVTYAKVEETKSKVEDIDMSVFLPKKEPITKEDSNKDNELKEYLQKKELERAEELKRSREEDQTVKFTSVKPPRKDPNRGMRFVSCTEPINKGKLGSSRLFTKKKDKEYY
ncbi:hypothetical protein OAN70_01340 [Candidatus Pelagibacter sp.]|nr:hypothetical protein [Candidatus Pelagibacter sp.]